MSLRMHCSEHNLESEATMARQASLLITPLDSRNARPVEMYLQQPLDEVMMINLLARAR